MGALQSPLFARANVSLRSFASNVAPAAGASASAKSPAMGATEKAPHVAPKSKNIGKCGKVLPEEDVALLGKVRYGNI